MKKYIYIYIYICYLYRFYYYVLICFISYVTRIETLQTIVYLIDNELLVSAFLLLLMEIIILIQSCR